MAVVPACRVTTWRGAFTHNPRQAVAVLCAFLAAVMLVGVLEPRPAVGQQVIARLAFVGTDGNVWLDDLAGNRVRVTDDAQRGHRTYDTPRWSPDGRRLVLLSGEPFNGVGAGGVVYGLRANRLKVFEVEGLTATLVAESTAPATSEFGWLKWNESVSVAVFSLSTGESSSQRTELYALDISTGLSTRIASARSFAAVEVAPSGSQVVYVAVDSYRYNFQRGVSEDKGEIRLFDLDGRESRTVAETTEFGEWSFFRPFFSPEGEALYYSTKPPRTSDSATLWRADVRTRAAPRLISTVRSGALRGAVGSFSPGPRPGSAFTLAGSPEGFDLVSVDLASGRIGTTAVASAPNRLPAAPDAPGAPQFWSLVGPRGGEWIVVSKIGSGVRHVAFAVRPDGSGLRQLPQALRLEAQDSRGGGGVDEVSWSEDGTSLAYQEGGVLYGEVLATGHRQALGPGYSPTLRPEAKAIASAVPGFARAPRALLDRAGPPRLTYIGRATAQMADTPPGDDDLWAVRADGTGRERLTRGVDVRSYAWSPDGCCLAFAAATPSTGAPGSPSDIWVLDFRSERVRRVTTDGASRAPTWSPDGRKVIFLSERDGVDLPARVPFGPNRGAPGGIRAPQVYEVDLAASVAARRLSTPGYGYGQATALDGSVLVLRYSDFELGYESPSTATAELVSITPRGTHVIAALGRIPYQFWIWGAQGIPVSADRTQAIAPVGDPANRFVTGLLLVDLRAGTSKVLRRGDSDASSFTPDGKSVLYSEVQSRYSGLGNPGEVYVSTIPLDGSPARRLVPTKFIVAEKPELTPDGAWLGFAAWENTPVSRIQVARAPFGERKDLGIGVAPAWQPPPNRSAVMFIHGLGETADSWKRRSMWAALEARGYDANHMDSFSFTSLAEAKQKEDVESSVIANARKLERDIALLSQRNQLAGGTGKVTIVAYSMGGLVARTYLTLSPSAADTVDRVFLIESPQRGSYLLSVGEWLLDQFSDASADGRSADGNLMVQAGAAAREYAAAMLRALWVDVSAKVAGKDIDGAAELDMVPGNTLLRYLDSPEGVAKLPRNVRYRNWYGDIDFRVGYQIYGYRIEPVRLAIGDGVILSEDAQLPNELNAPSTALKGTVGLDMTLDRFLAIRRGKVSEALLGLMPSAFHLNAPDQLKSLGIEDVVLQEIRP